MSFLHVGIADNYYMIRTLHNAKTAKACFGVHKRNCHISRKQFRPGGMAPSEWTSSVRAVSDTPVAVYTVPGVKTTRRVTYRPPIAISPFVLALSVSSFKQTLWRTGQL